MEIKRYIIAQAVLTEEKILIPIWDERIVFEKTTMGCNIITIKNSSNPHKSHSIIECIYDLKTKELSNGIELDSYPTEDELEFKKGENVLFKTSHQSLAEATINDVVFEEFDMEIKRGKKIDKWWTNKFKVISFDENLIYAIKIWKPFYILDNGLKIKWNHQLYHKSTI